MTYATVVKGPAGLGKTTLIVEALASKGTRAEYYAPTHALAEEVENLFLEENPTLSVRVIGGRSHEGPDGKPLCKKYKIAEEVARAGGEVYSSLCEKKKGRKEKCQHYATCPYIAQFMPADVTIYTHAHLPLQRMGIEQGVPDIAVIDESFWSSCIEVIEVPVGLLRAPFLDQPTAHVFTQIEHALTQGLPVFRHLSQAGISGFECIAAKKAVGRGAGMTPSMTATQQRDAIRRVRERSLLRRLLETLIIEYLTQRSECQGLVYLPETQTIRVHCKKRITRLHEGRHGFDEKTARVLVIDASADETIIRQWFPDARMIPIAATRSARVVQVVSSRCSTTSLVPKRNTNAANRRDARKRLRQLQAFIYRVAAQHDKVLLVGPQAIVGNPKAKVKPLLKTPVNVTHAHFNALRGIDMWKDHDAIIVVGRNQPPITAVEENARCVFLEDGQPLAFASDWAMQERGYRLKSGQQGVTVATHPDLRAQAVLEQKRECESQQAIDRLRLVHADSPKTVYILSNLPLDIDVDELVTWDELMEGNRIEQAWNTHNGVMPLAPEWLAANFPQLWGTSGAAKVDVHRWRKELQITNTISISNLKLFEHQYRPVAARRQRSWSAFIARESDPEAARSALEALLGCPVRVRTACERRSVAGLTIAACREP